MALDELISATSPRPGQRVSDGCALLCLIPVLFVVVLGEIYGLKDQSETSSWPTTSGVVTQSRVSTMGAWSIRRQPVVIYQYFVGGTRYESRRVDAGFWRMSHRLFRTNQGVVDTYPAGSTVTVSYNPANPDAAVLRPGVTARDWLEAAGMVVPLGLLGVVLVRSVLRAARPDSGV